MTKEELKEMIDNTITTNGNKEITGQALNLALNAIVDAMGEQSSGGGVPMKQLYITNSDSPERDMNKQLYQDLQDWYNGRTAPFIVYVQDSENIQFIDGINYDYDVRNFSLIKGSLAYSLASDGNVSQYTMPSAPI